jgi:hypothetical protein
VRDNDPSTASEPYSRTSQEHRAEHRKQIAGLLLFAAVEGRVGLGVRTPFLSRAS